MISGQILQSALDGIRSITYKEISVVSRDGVELAATAGSELFQNQSQEAALFFISQAESQLVNGCQYFKIFENGIGELAVLIRGEDEETYRIGKMTALHIQNLMVAYKERYDKDNFVKNLLLDNLLLIDIYSRAKKLKIENNARRVAYVIEAQTERESDLSVIEMVKNMFPEKNKDLVTALDRVRVILIKELKPRDDAKEIEKTAHMLCDTISAETMCRVMVSIGSAVNELKQVSASYKEAMMALEVGKIFDSGKDVINYDRLGIGRLIYHMPKSLCKMFVTEVLRGNSVDQIDEETVATVTEFFRNNLNISETSRKLIIHRNTLVYRLDRLQRITGLDLRNFDDAVIFNLTLMITRFLYYKNVQESE